MDLKLELDKLKPTSQTFNKSWYDVCTPDVFKACIMMIIEHSPSDNVTTKLNDMYNTYSYNYTRFKSIETDNIELVSTYEYMYSKLLVKQLMYLCGWISIKFDILDTKTITDYMITRRNYIIQKVFSAPPRLSTTSMFSNMEDIINNVILTDLFKEIFEPLYIAICDDEVIVSYNVLNKNFKI